MADYTWRQWEAEQNDANLLHASDCERWQAGIELAGGTWDGNWTDLDTSGKGLITIDQFNALESQIQSKVSSYTPKNYDPDSTVQIVPGPDGWNKVEDGILKAVCTPDGINRNLCINTLTMSIQAPSANASASGWSAGNADSSAPSGYYVSFTAPAATNDFCGYYWGSNSVSERLLGSNLSEYLTTGTVFTFSVWMKATGGTATFNIGQMTNQTILSNSEDNELTDEWKRIWVTAQRTDAALMLRLYRNACDSDMTIYLSGMKMEVGSELTDWSPAFEDYGYEESASSISATPQSVEDSDEIPAVEAGEIE